MELEIQSELMVGEQLTQAEIETLFDSVVEHGNGNIGETFLVCRIKELPDDVWSFMKMGTRYPFNEYRLIYKYNKLS